MLHRRCTRAGIVVVAAAVAGAVPSSNKTLPLPYASDSPQISGSTLQALQVLQHEYFQPWLGTWPTSIDWTAAVMGSHLSGALDSLAHGLELVHSEPGDDDRARENTINYYFSQLVSFYFGQDAFAIRNEAFDDMLWVVLGWLDAVQFVALHSARYYTNASSRSADPNQPASYTPSSESWYGNLWVPAFSHRARLFWDLASTGWSTTLCGGGMDWNPRLEPYKNAITNELYIAASINMYLHFPGDANAAPFPASSGPQPALSGSTSPPKMAEWPARDARYLAAAIEGYKWLTTSGMVNDQGLYTDGFHISGYNNASSNNTQCDQRNDMVYTCNQGVLLTGQRGLFDVTGISAYLDDGHALVRSAIAATGWDLHAQSPVDNLTKLMPGQLPPWHGLGRAGVLEDACDMASDCSQDSQTFKGIYMHHFTAFCAPLARIPGLQLATTLSEDGFQEAQRAHKLACRAYTPWLRHNARAALGTRDARGRFGMWWTAGLLNMTTIMTTTTTTNTTKVPRDTMMDPSAVPPLGPNTTDYRTHGVPVDLEWMHPIVKEPAALRYGGVGDTGDDGQHPLVGHRPPLGEPLDLTSPPEPSTPRRRAKKGRGHDGLAAAVASDPNDRGRGRTVETQGGGLAVLRAYWESSRLGPP